MFKNFKKHSKLLLLGLIFSVALPFSSSATDPQDTSNLDIVHKISDLKKEKKNLKRKIKKAKIKLKNKKRKLKETKIVLENKERELEKERKEKISKVLSDEYDLNSMIPGFVAEGDDTNQWAKCEMPAIYRLSDENLLGSSHPKAGPCNQPVKNFSLISDRNHIMHVIGSDCIKHFRIPAPLDLDKNLPKRLKNYNPLGVQSGDHPNQTFISTKILKYFYNQENWKFHDKLKVFILDLNKLKDELKEEGQKLLPLRKTLKKFWLMLWLHDNYEYYFTIYCDNSPSSTKTSSSPFDRDNVLSDDKIFEAFKFFCERQKIYQPFTLEK